MDKPFDFEFWGRGFDPNSRRLFCFVLDSILFFYMKLVLYVSIDNNINCDKCVFNIITFRYNECLHLYFVHSIVKFLFSSDSKTKPLEDTATVKLWKTVA